MVEIKTTSPAISIDILSKQNRAIFKISGEINGFEGRKIEEEFSQLYEKGTTQFVLNMSLATHLSVPALKSLLRLRKKSEVDGFKLKIINFNKDLLKLADIFGVKVKDRPV